jgi:hypothetical protein
MRRKLRGKKKIPLWDDDGTEEKKGDSWERVGGNEKSKYTKHYFLQRNGSQNEEGKEEARDANCLRREEDVFVYCAGCRKAS